MNIRLVIDGKTIPEHFKSAYAKNCYRLMKEDKPMYSWFWLLNPSWRLWYNQYVDNRFFKDATTHKQKGNWLNDRIDLFKTNGFKHKLKIELWLQFIR